MTASKQKKRGRAALILLLCLLVLCLAAGGTAYALLQQKVRAIQAGAEFDFSYTVTSPAALYGVLQQAGAAQGTVSGQYAPGKFQFALTSGKTGNAFTRVYIDAKETLYDAGQLYTYLRNEVVSAAPVLPGWSMGSYISQTQLASLLGVELSAVELQDMTSLSLTLGALQKVSPAGALDGYTYYQLPAGESGLTCIVGLPLKTLFAKETPLHILLTIPEHEVTIALNGTVTAAETAVVAPSSRMTDADVQRFVELRKALESFTDVLQSLLS